jgi:formyl-CoA transferase
MLNAVGVPAGRVISVPDALSLDQVRGRELVEEFEDFEVLGKPLHLITAGYRVNGAGRRLHCPPPELGQHTDEILGQAGYSPEEVAALREASAI